MNRYGMDAKRLVPERDYSDFTRAEQADREGAAYAGVDI